MDTNASVDVTVVVAVNTTADVSGDAEEFVEADVAVLNLLMLLLLITLMLLLLM